MKEDAMPKRPWTVTTAVYMLYLSLGLSVPDLLRDWDWLKDLSAGLQALILGVVLGLWLAMALWFYMVGRGRNWARILLLIQLLLGAPSSLLHIIKAASGSSPYPEQLYQIIQWEIQIVTVLLLFQRSSSRWFRAMEKLRAKDGSVVVV
jgi:hypothetical protein